jgi:hypothetical protein
MEEESAAPGRVIPPAPALSLCAQSQGRIFSWGRFLKRKVLSGLFICFFSDFGVCKRDFLLK